MNYLHAIRLEEFQIRIGLDPTVGAEEFRERGPFEEPYDKAFL